MISPDVEKLIVKFLKKNCYGDFNYIMGYSNKLSVVHNTKYSSVMGSGFFDVKKELVIKCNFKTFDTFPGYNGLGDKLYTTLKPLLKDFKGVSIESHSSTYYCKD